MTVVFIGLSLGVPLLFIAFRVTHVDLSVLACKSKLCKLQML